MDDRVDFRFGRVFWGCFLHVLRVGTLTIFYWVTYQHRACKIGARSSAGNNTRNDKELKYTSGEMGTE